MGEPDETPCVAAKGSSLGKTQGVYKLCSRLFKVLVVHNIVPAIATPFPSVLFNGQIPNIVLDSFGNATVVWYLAQNPSTVKASSKFSNPTVLGISPNVGPVQGGDSVTITGTNFINVTEVLFGTTSAPNFTVTSPTTITVTTPPGTVGTVDVTVIASSQSSPITVNDQYTYQASTPLPPSRFSGHIKKRKGSPKHKYLLTAKWSPSTSMVTSYKIYKRSRLVATLTADAKRQYQVHLLWKSSFRKFSIASVNAQNKESVRKRLKLKH